MDSRRIKIASILIALTFLVATIVRGQVINDNGLSGFTWYNGTNLWVDDVYTHSENATQALWDNLGAAAYIGFDTNRAYQENYFLVDGTNDRASVQAALNYVNRLGGGKIISELGVVQIESNLYLPSAELYIIEGEGLCNVLTSPLTTGGSVWSLINGARFLPNVTSGADLVTNNLVFDMQGVYNDSALDFATSGNGHWWSSYSCAYAFRGTVPTGNGGNPSSTLSGNCLNVGGVSGPSNLVFTWVDNRFYDNRQGGNASSCLMMFSIEELVFERNFFRVGFQNSLVTPNLMFVSPVSGASISYNCIFTESAWDTAGSQYAKQIMCTGADKNFQMNFNQFLEESDISASHLYTNSGVMNVEGMYPIYAEGGTDPVNLTVSGGGTVNVRMDGRGYEVKGSTTILNGNTNVNVTHGLLGPPTFISVTGTTADSDLLRIGNVDVTNVQIIASDGAVGGNRRIYYHFIYTITG